MLVNTSMSIKTSEFIFHIRGNYADLVSSDYIFYREIKWDISYSQCHVVWV